MPSGSVFFFSAVRFSLAFLFRFWYHTCVGWAGFLSFFLGAVMLPSLSAVSRSACCRSASGFACRPSLRALGGFVAAVGFASSARAGAFASLWAAALPAACRGCVVRFGGGLWWVSVPVLPASAPAVVRSGSPLVAVGSPAAVRSAVSSPGVWSC